MGVAVVNTDLKLTNPMKYPKNPSHNSNRTNRIQSNSRKRSPNTSPRPAVCLKAPAKNLVMGQVKILKRGEDLKRYKPSIKSVNVDKENVGPNRVSVPFQIRFTELKSNDNKSVPAPFYAGSAAFTISPPPSSVPLPAFCTNKIRFALKNEVATDDLTRMLKLEL